MSYWDWSTTAANNDSVGNINWAEGQVPGSVNNSARAQMADVAKWRDDSSGALTLAGGTTAYTLTTNGVLVTPVDGVKVHAVCNTTNTGASTLNIDGTGVKDIKKVSSAGEADIDAGEMVANQHYIFEYDASADGATGAWVLLNPSGFTGGTIKDYGEAVNAIGSTGGGTQDIDLELGNVVTATVDTSANTFTFSNPPASGTAGSFTLILTNGGSQTVNWPASVTWPAGGEPTLTSSGIDVLTFVTVDGGTTWRGTVAGLNFS